ncbi:hypothetical protein LguiA_026250 [Lonicera macranthoides]
MKIENERVSDPLYINEGKTCGNFNNGLDRFLKHIKPELIGYVPQGQSHNSRSLQGYIRHRDTGHYKGDDYGDDYNSKEDNSGAVSFYQDKGGGRT